MGPLILASGGEEVVMVMVTGGVTIAVISVVVNAIRSVKRTREREQSRREIAAYIAEGSMSPEQGERLMASGESEKA